MQNITAVDFVKLRNKPYQNSTKNKDLLTVGDTKNNRCSSYFTVHYKISSTEEKDDNFT